MENAEGGGGGGTQSCWVVLTRVLEVLTILEGGTKCFHSLKDGGGRGGGEGGRGAIRFGPRPPPSL